MGDCSFQPLANNSLNQETIKGIVHAWKGEKAKAAFYRQIAQADSKYTDEIQNKYSSIKTPTLILWGENDKWIPVENGEKLNKLIPNSKFKTIPNSGHLVIEEKYQDLLIEILKFIK